MIGYLKQWLGQSATLWIASKMLFSNHRKILSTTGWISLIGLILGVASLVVSMAVISGFETTLQKNISDVSGDIQIYKMNSDPAPIDQMIARIKNIEPDIEAFSRFFVTEGVLAHRGKLSGVFLQGVDADKIKQVLNLQSRLKWGDFQLGPASDGTPQILIGKGIAENFNLKPGDNIRLVVPINTDFDVSEFRRRIGNFRIAGVLDLGKYEYDQRWMFTSLAAAQELAEIGDRYSGFLIKLHSPDQAHEASLHLSHGLGREFRVRDWRDINENLFEAIKIEKVVIFFVIFIIVVAAAFNVASSLYINVVRSYPEIGMMKALGLSQKRLARIFSVQGVLLGGLGCGLGMILGFILCLGFTVLENKISILPASVYKVDRIDVQLRSVDLLSITVATLVICYLATWAPARRAAQMTAVEGLRHE